MTPLKLIHVGMGGWGRDWARLLARRPDLVETLAWVDIQPAMLDLVRADHPTATAAYFSTVEEALEATEAEAVLVTTPLAYHVPVVVAALEAGKHVLVEKPFAPSVEDARRAVEVADAAGLTLMVSQNYRHYPAAQAAASLVREGSLGPVSSVSVDFRKYANTAPVEGHLHYGLVHPMLLDMAIHHFDLMRFVLGQEPVSVTSVAWNPPWSRFAEPASALATVTFDGGAVVDYNGSWVSPGPDTLWAGNWRIECEGGIIEFSCRGNDNARDTDWLHVQPLGKPKREVDLEHMPNYDRLGSVAEFLRSVRENTVPGSSGRENLGTLSLTYGTIAAAESGERVTF